MGIYQRVKFDKILYLANFSENCLNEAVFFLKLEAILKCLNF